MKPSKSLIIFVSLFAGFFLAGCGPVNAKSSNAFAPTGVTKNQCPNSLGSSLSENLNSSDKNTFVIRSEPKTATGKPGTGTPTNYEFRVVHESDLSALSSDTTITIQYARVSTGAANPKINTVTAVRQADGCYTAALLFKHAGVYQVQMSIVERGQTDAHTFDVTL